MKISRRIFLNGVGASAATWLSFRRIGLNQAAPRAEGFLDCALLDLQAHCVLRESLQGYQAALAGEHNLVEAIPGLTRGYRLVIVPGLGSIDPALAQTLSNLMKAGTHLLLESGAGFLSPAEFAAQRRMLHHSFNLAVLPPVDLWPRKSADHTFFASRHGLSPGNKLDRHESIPYVNYTWPIETQVRDFSRLIPVSAEAGDVIGSVGTLPVSVKRRMGNGTLIFLGSPLGPALRAGDPEARSWLLAVGAS